MEDLGLVPLKQDAPVEVREVSDGKPAKAAGLQPHDLITAVDGLHLHSVDALIAYLKDGAGKPVVLTVERRRADGSTQTLALPVTPVYADNQQGKSWQTGFAPEPVARHVDRLPFAQALAESYAFNLKNSKLIFVVLHRLFTRQVSVKSLSSPIGIGVMVHQAFKASDLLDPSAIILTMAMISLNLGIFNLLPIPILDGGMIVFLFIETLMRRDLNPHLKERIYQVAFRVYSAVRGGRYLQRPDQVPASARQALRISLLRPSLRLQKPLRR